MSNENEKIFQWKNINGFVRGIIEPHVSALRQRLDAYIAFNDDRHMKFKAWTETNVERLDNRIDELWTYTKKEVNRLDIRINDLTEYTEREISRLDNKIDDLRSWTQSQLTSLRSYINSEIRTLSNRISSEVSSLNSSISSLESSTQTSINKVNSNVNGNALDISELEKNVKYLLDIVPKNTKSGLGAFRELVINSQGIFLPSDGEEWAFFYLAYRLVDIGIQDSNGWNYVIDNGYHELAFKIVGTGRAGEKINKFTGISQRLDLGTIGFGFCWRIK